MLKALRQQIRQYRLMQPGERVAVGVSGGADSVALLLGLVELRAELGVVLSVAHFNHRIRGAEADGDESFVAELAVQHGLVLHAGSGDAPARVKSKGESLETAARELRYGYFNELARAGAVDKVATAHTADDQAETVVMRLVRGAATRGLAGIYPERKDEAGGARIVRPLLGVRRKDVEEFLRERGQRWREDSSNREMEHTRNRIRHELMPLLQGYNPAVVENLARTAEVARDEEEYWKAETERLLPLVLLPGKATRGGGRSVGGEAKSAGAGMDIGSLRRHPMALQRRLLRAVGESLGMALDAAHVESVLGVAEGAAKRYELPGGWQVQRTLRELRFERRAAGKEAQAARDYEYVLPIPGKVSVPDVNLVVRAHLRAGGGGNPAYNRATSSEPGRVGAGESEPLSAVEHLNVRNWRPGDRFRAAHSRAEKKVKDLLQEMKVPADERSGWPVIVADERVVWVRGARPAAVWLANGGEVQQLIIESEEISKTEAR